MKPPLEIHRVHCSPIYTSLIHITTLRSWWDQVEEVVHIGNMHIICVHTKNMLITCVHTSNMLITCVHVRNMLITCVHTRNMLITCVLQEICSSHAFIQEICSSHIVDFFPCAICFKLYECYFFEMFNLF